jgi:hypothetical protein
MIDPELLTKLDEISKKADLAYRAAETARKYLFWTGVVSIAVFVLPLLGLFFVIPQFIQSYTATLQGVGF